MVSRSVSLVPSVRRWQLLPGKGRTEAGVLCLLALFFPKPVRGSLTGDRTLGPGFPFTLCSPPPACCLPSPPTPPPLLQLRPDAFCALLVCVGCAVGVGVCCLSWWRCLESSSPPCGCQRLKAEPTVPCCSFHVAGTPTRGGSHDLIGVGGGVLKEVIFYGTWLFP